MSFEKRNPIHAFSGNRMVDGAGWLKMILVHEVQA